MNTEEKIKLIRDIGVSLPTINYDLGGYESVLIKNVYIGDGMRGIEVPEIHETFDLACDRIIKHHS